MKTGKQQIVILGCGNVAWHFAKALHALGTFNIVVCNHRPNKLLKDFQSQLNCKIETDFENITGNADFYLLCLSDKALPKVAKNIQITNPKAVLMHSSGSIALSVFGERVQGTAVFYPLQTFSRNDQVDWTQVPLLIETKEPSTLAIAKKLALCFSKTVLAVTAEQRALVHLSAVLVNNFTNALYVAADGLMPQKMGIKTLLPLIRQTSAKLENMSPAAAQTGPAKRGDKNVMKKHMQQLEKNDALKKVYKDLSQLIKLQQHA